MKKAKQSPRYTVTEALWARPSARWSLVAGWAIVSAAVVIRQPTGGGWWLVVAAALTAGVLWGVRLRIDVTEAAIISRSGGMRHELSRADIAKVELREYDPKREFGGWGWRHRPDGARLFAMVGTTAVVVTTHAGHERYYGVNEPGDLHRALEDSSLS